MDSTLHAPVLQVAAGADRFGRAKEFGISSIAFKLTGQDTHNELFIPENSLEQKGGPGNHLHHAQDGWFYVLEGEFLFEISGERICAKPGVSVFTQRKTPHVWAFLCGRRVGAGADHF